MADFDILAALEATPDRGENRCKLQLFIDSIPADYPGLDRLLERLANAKAHPAQQLTLTFSAMNHPMSAKIINDHRADRCLCWR